jgi:hypothetical protein
MECGRVEIVTTGIDEALQLIGGDAYGRFESTGLRIPTLPTATAGTMGVFGGLPAALFGRYLFVLAQFSLASGTKARLRGWRQMATLGVRQTGGAKPRVVEQMIENPYFKLDDGNISWHLMDLGPPGPQDFPFAKQGPNDLQNLAFRFSNGPALLYETTTQPAGDPFYVDMTSYTPPNKGRPWGQALLPGFGNILDLRVPWKDSQAWHSLDIPLEGPRTIALFASVRQSNPDTREALSIATVAPFPLGLSPEEQFLKDFPTAIYWRVGGALIADL